MKLCNCGSGKNFGECCEPVIKGKRKPVTAEELMRARYSAFVEHDIDFIMDTVAPNSKESMPRDGVKKWAERNDWKKLEIIKTVKGEKGDDEGYVEFKAHSVVENISQAHHENARFIKIKGTWYFEDGEQILPETVKRDAPKTGRNDPCPCGSGKKFKKCCAGKN
jgi:SEC-C motif-containing protein